jgi:hypothetical protein
MFGGMAGMGPPWSWRYSTIRAGASNIGPEMARSLPVDYLIFKDFRAHGRRR